MLSVIRAMRHKDVCGGAAIAGGPRSKNSASDLSRVSLISMLIPRPTRSQERTQPDRADLSCKARRAYIASGNRPFSRTKPRRPPF